jgi:hypothetical protein
LDEVRRIHFPEKSSTAMANLGEKRYGELVQMLREIDSSETAAKLTANKQAPCAK